MKNMKTLLAVIMALCLVMSLSIPVMATTVDTTPTTTAASEPTGTSESTNPTENSATEPTEEQVVEDEETETPVEDENETEEHDHDHEETAPEAGWKKPVRIVLTVLEVIASVALAIIVLMQSGKESGLSGAISGNNDSYMSKSGKGGLDKLLAKSTKWVALVWLLLTLALSLI